MTASIRAHAGLRARTLAAVLACALLAACHDVTEVRDEDRVEALLLPPAGTVADGVSLFAITAVLAAGTPLDQRTVTFTTTAGQFLVAGKAEATATVTAGADQRATVLYRVPNEPAKALITAAAAGGTRTDSVVFARRAERFTKLDVLPSATAVADGATLLDVIAEFAPDTPADQRSVTFTTTAGAFLLPGKTDATATVTAGADGKAAVLLRVPADATRALVSATAAGTTRSQAVTFTPRPSTPAVDRLRDVVAADTGTADAASLTEVVAVLAEGTPADQRTVTFTTTAGQFVGAGTVGATTAVVAGPDLRAVTLLRAPADSTRALVTATAGVSVRSRTIIYRRAQPERLDLVPERFFVRAGVANELALFATLRRAVGTPSPRVRVLFTATDTTPQRTERGRFTAAAPSDSAGVVRVRFTTADSLFRGPLVIHAITDTPTPVRDSVVIQVLP